MPPTADTPPRRPAVRERRTLLQRLRAYWMAYALRLAEIQTQIVLTVLYVFVFGAANLILRVLRKDLLGKSARKASYWIPHERQPETLERFRHPF